MKKFHGVFTATVTPIDSNGKVDLDYVRKHLRFQEEAGIDGIVPSGTNGEGPLLSLDERKKLIEISIENKGKMAVIAGTGCMNLPETIELTQFAEKAGADAVLVLPSFYYRADHAGILEFYSRLLDKVSIPVMLYNIPQLTGVEITHRLLSDLSDRPNMIGLKDSCGDFEKTKAFIKNFPNLIVHNGDDKSILDAFKAGAQGTVSGMSNVFPEIVVKIYRSFIAGEDSSTHNEFALKISAALNEYQPFTANKPALEFLGFPASYMRPPLVDMTNEQKNALQAELRKLDLL